MKKTILYIEDNPDNVILVGRALAPAGYDLIAAGDGTQGIFIAENQDVDLILLDINLPDMDGYEVARRLRASTKRSLAHTPIIALTVNARKGDAERAISAGCDVYMSKPINFHEFQARVRAFAPNT